MAGQDDDEFFSDDDLDNLNPEVLQGLENQAIQFTQHQQKVQDDSSDYGEDDLDDEDLEEVVDEGRILGTQIFPVPTLRVGNNNISHTVQPVQSQFVRPVPQRATPVYPQSRNVQPVAASIPPSTYTQREQFRQQRYSSNAIAPFAADRSRSQSTQQPTLRAQPVVARSQENPAVVDALQKQLQELMKERDSLKKDVDSKAGEIAIIRKKQESSTRTHEREVAAIKKLNADELAKQRKAIEQAKDAEKKAFTELEFMKRDLAEEQNLRKATASKLNKAPATPTKKKLAHRDGFDDDEVQSISPSKFRARRSNPTTPTKAGKRKRKPESPIAELDVHIEEPAAVETEKRPSVIIDEALLERLGRQDERLDFLQNMLNHRPSRGHPQTFEAFSEHFFPSSPDESFSSIILGKLPLISSKKSTDDFPIDFCELILSLWSRCLAEKYTKPIYLMIDLLMHAMNLKTLSIAPHILDSLLPLAQSTGDLIAIPRFKREPINPPNLETDISTTSCLTLLYLTALGCVSRTEYLIRFWRLIRIDFVLMMLSLDQPPSDFGLMLQLLRMSVLRENKTFGPISQDPEIQDLHMGYVIERLTSPFSDPPLSVASSKRAPESRISDRDQGIPSLIHSQLRLEILITLTTISRISIGGRAMAKHAHAIGRLVAIISSTMDSLYDCFGGRSLRIADSKVVTLATRLLHRLVKGYEAEVGVVQEKLGSVRGGTHRYLVALARLALRDEEGIGEEEDGEESGDLVLEGGIGVGVGECARELLEVACTMEEADAIHEALVGGD